MNIAMSLLSGVSYGGTVYFQNLIPALAASDQKNTYHLFVTRRHSFAVRQGNFLFHECIGENTSALKRFLWEQLVLPYKLKKYKIDILFTAKNLNVFFAPCKTVIALRNMEPLAYREYNNDWKLNVILWLKRQLTKWSVAKADHIITVSQAVKDRAAKCFSGIASKVTVVYNGNPVDKNVKCQMSNVKCSFILTASKFVAYANQLNLLKGYALLVEKNAHTPHLWLAGGVHDKKYFQKVQRYVEDAGLKERVRFLGLVPHDQLIARMREASLFVFPSTLESCPHTLIEAMACGAPIAASNTPPMPEICSDAALYFDPQSPEDIARTIARVLHNQSERERLSSRGIMRARDFTWDATAQELLKVFASAGPS